MIEHGVTARVKKRSAEKAYIDEAGRKGKAIASPGVPVGLDA
jgi:hypothetical protein